MTASVMEPSKKRSADEAELEIDINAAEPMSKKALRKAKKAKPQTSEDPNTNGTKTEGVTDLQRLETFDGDRSDYGVWVGNLTFTTTKKDLFEFLTTKAERPIPAAKITRMHLPQNESRRAQNRGFAYVDFTDAETLETAISLSESLSGGRRLLIKDAKNFQGRPEVSKTDNIDTGKPPSRKIFVGNLDFATTKESLQKHFSPCGPIASTFLTTFEDSGKCKGYGWIVFEDVASAKSAMRGWVEVDQPAKHTSRVTPDTAPNGGMQKKRIWLHRMGDRKLRMEFAEDNETRYKKRYGKSARTATTTNREIAADDEALNGANETEANGTTTSRSNRTSIWKPRPQSGRSRAADDDDLRYDKATVQKLRGAIVEGKGQKVEFD